MAPRKTPGKTKPAGEVAVRADDSAPVKVPSTRIDGGPGKELVRAAALAPRTSGTAHSIQTTMEPGKTITVSETEYEFLLQAGLVYSGSPVAPVADAYDELFADKVTNGSATPSAMAAAVGGSGPVGTALRAAYVPKWKASTAYAAGEPVLNPSGQTVTAKSAFTSGATYDSTKWTVVSAVADATTTAKGIVQLAGDLAGTATAPTVPALSGKLSAASNLSDVASTATARTNLGLGTAATSAASAFDASGAAAAAQAASVPLTQRGAANGVATLDGTGKVPQAQIPAVALTDFLGAVASQAAMLALTGQRGDWCTRTDLGTDWQLIADDPTQLANWRQHTYPASPVSSVAGRTGAVTLSAGDVSGLATVATTGSYGDLTAKPTIPTVGAAGAGAAVALSSTDASVTNARTPTAHAATHAAGGSDVLSPASIGSPAVFNVKSAAYGAVGDGVADDATAIQAAVNAAISAGGGIIWFPAGNYKIGTTIQVYGASNVLFQGQGIFQNNVSAAPMVRFRNANYCGTAPTLQWIGNWKASSIALELDGSLYGDFTVRGDTWPTGINVITSASATQNSAFNDLALDIANGITGMFFQGGNSRYASNNRISRFTWGSAGSGAPIGINFSHDTDTNVCKWAYISLNVTGAIGVIYNSASPSTDQQVYENHFEELILEGYTTGTVGIKGNMTTSYGTRASYVRYRLSGPSLPSVSVAGNSEIIFYNSTDGVNGYTTGFAVPSTTTAPSAGGAGALPATPTGYMTISVNGTPRKIAYY